MLADGRYTAVIDRIEDGIATVLVEADGKVVEEVTIDDLDRIPTDARHDGAVVQVTVDGGDVVDLEYDPETEEERRQQNRDRFDRLSKRPPGRDDDS